MAGRAAIEEIDFKTIPNVYVLDHEKKFIPAHNPLNLYSNIKKEPYRQRLGLVYPFAQAISRAYPKDSILLVVNARGGTAIENFMKGDTLGYYDKTLLRIKQALKNEPSATLEAFIWHQGESNRGNYKNYLNKVNTLIADYRKDLSIENLPLITGQLGLWNSEYENIRQEISKTESVIPNAFLVSSHGLTNFDDHHFDSKSQRLFGLRYARKYLEFKGASEKDILNAVRADSFESKKQMLSIPIENYVMVAAHRGDWRDGSENSIQAIEMAIEMGVDIVEVDVAVTLDSIPILMHDATLNRTTTCQGEVNKMTYSLLKKCRIKDGLQYDTEFEIPTLEQALLAVKGKVLINLDKAEDHIPGVYQVLKKTETIDQAIFSSYYPYEKLKKIAGKYLDSIIYMPKIKHDTEAPENYLNTYLQNTKSVILQTRALSEKDSLLDIIPIAKSKNMWLWMNTLDTYHAAGHTDEKAIYNPDLHWGWVIGQGANIIQTDRPKLLLDYLKEKGLHN